MVLQENVFSIVHPMLFPGPGNTRATQRGEAPASYLLRSIRQIIDDPFFGGIEITQIKDPELRAQVGKMVADVQMEGTYGAELVELLHDENSVVSTDV